MKFFIHKDKHFALIKFQLLRCNPLWGNQNFISVLPYRCIFEKSAIVCKFNLHWNHLLSVLDNWEEGKARCLQKRNTFLTIVKQYFFIIIIEWRLQTGCRSRLAHTRLCTGLLLFVRSGLTYRYTSTSITTRACALLSITRTTFQQSAFLFISIHLKLWFVPI